MKETILANVISTPNLVNFLYFMIITIFISIFDNDNFIFKSLMVSSFILDSAEWRSKRGYFDVRYGQDAYLECEISGTFIGFFNPKNEKINVVAGGRYKISGPTDNIKVLEISKVTEDDYGTYYCKDSTSNSTANLDIGGMCR